MTQDIPEWPGGVVWMMIYYDCDVLTVGAALFLKDACTIDYQFPDIEADGIIVGDVYRREDYERIVKAVKEVQEREGPDTVRLVVEIDGGSERCSHGCASWSGR